jgi:hypothetical protein
MGQWSINLLNAEHNIGRMWLHHSSGLLPGLCITPFYLLQKEALQS